MENTLITTGAIAGIIAGAYLAGAAMGDGHSMVWPLIGAMIGAVGGGWVLSLMVGRQR